MVALTWAHFTGDFAGDLAIGAEWAGSGHTIVDCTAFAGCKRYHVVDSVYRGSFENRTGIVLVTPNGRSALSFSCACPSA